MKIVPIVVNHLKFSNCDFELITIRFIHFKQSRCSVFYIKLFNFGLGLRLEY